MIFNKTEFQAITLTAFSSVLKWYRKQISVNHPTPVVAPVVGSINWNTGKLSVQVPHPTEPGKLLTFVGDDYGVLKHGLRAACNDWRDAATAKLPAAPWMPDGGPSNCEPDQLAPDFQPE